jgi:hypothetical protein
MDRVTDPADPRRCKASAKTEQCWNVADEGFDYCRSHARHVANPHGEQRRQYQLTQARLRGRLNQKTDHDEIKSLREEIGLTRILIEELFNSAKDQNELLQKSATFIGLAQTLERLIKTSHQIEQNLGMLLSKPTIIVMAQNIVQILNEELQGIDGYEKRIDKIHGRMFDTIEAATNTEEQKT